MLRYQIINHRTEDDAPAWHWYIINEKGKGVCQGCGGFGTRKAAMENMEDVAAQIRMFSADTLVNWYARDKDPGLKDPHYLEETRAEKWAHGWHI